MSDRPMSGRRKSRISTTNEVPISPRATRPSSSRSFTSTNTASDFPEGRTPRDSFVMEDDAYPSGRQPRGSVAMDGVPLSPRATRPSSTRSFTSTNTASEFPEGRTLRSSFVMEGASTSTRSFTSASTASDFPEGRTPRGSFVMEEAAYPSGRQPRGSVAMDGYHPTDRKPRASVVMKQAKIVEKETIIEEHGARRRRKRIAVLTACSLSFILIIIILLYLFGTLGTGDTPTRPVGGVPEGCVVNNETKPETYDDFMCDLMTTLTTDDSTFLRTYPTSSPYGMAVGWLTNTDMTDFEILPREQALERFVMTLFYFATGGKDWYNKFAFLTQDHVCDWTGDSANVVRCTSKETRQVTDLGIPQNGMAGALPAEIGYLTGLTRIYFSLNSLTGTIPSEIALLTNLQKLYLDRNNMRGKIPAGLNDLNLTTLYLTSNDFNGDLTGLCDNANAAGLEFDFHSDCETGRVGCPCCKTCA